MTYRNHFSTRQTPQAEPIPGREAEMVKNEDGGYVFAVDDWKRLDRFLILGSEGGTYYVNERALTIDNAEAVQRCIGVDGARVVRRIVEVSDAGRAPKNDPALFALAMCAGLGDDETRRVALAALPKVARIGTHLFHFLEYVEGFRGWGRGLRRAVANWYNETPVDKLAYQAVKYRQRDGWSHRDALRLAHPKTEEGQRNEIYKWITEGKVSGDYSVAIISAFERAKYIASKHIASKTEKLKLIIDEGLTREMVPTEWLTDPDVWAALMHKMPLGATLRNLGKTTQVGLLKPMASTTTTVARRLTDQAYIQKSRLHPLSILVALKIYAQGHGLRGKLSWSPVREIVDALDEAFYLSFGNVAPTGKRILIGVDVSGSMMYGTIAGMPLHPGEAAAALALVTAKTESQFHIVGYDTAVYPKALGPRTRLDHVIADFGYNAGGTACAAPILYALQEKVEVDVFVTITDNDTWAGRIHPNQALHLYRAQMGIEAKLVTVGMTASGFSIADPDDGGMLDIVGYDVATPSIISDFIRNN